MGVPERRDKDVVVGRVLAPWGLRGGVKVESLSDSPGRFKPGGTLFVKGRCLTIHRAFNRKGNTLVLELEGVTTPQEAASLRGEYLTVGEEEVQPLGQGAYYHFQVLGLRVYDTSGECLGTVREILNTGSNDVYVVRSRDREILLPAIEDVIRNVDLERGTMTVELLEGLA